MVSAIRTITSIPDEHLSDRDKILRDAARVIAEEVVRPPVASSASVPPTDITAENAPLSAAVTTQTDGQPAVTESTGVWRSSTPVMEDLSPEYQNTVSSGRSKLDEIDALLKKEGSLP
ncbi:chemotaxis protein [compost metagenome]